MGKQTVSVKLYDLVSRAVSEGVATGWRRSHKHAEFPDPQYICESMESEVMNALCEVIEFSEGD